jgi:hypothetical protein
MDLLGRSPKTYPPTGAKCSTARRYESELRDRSPSRGTLDHSQRPRRYEGHFASTGTRNSKVRTLLFLRIRRGNLLTFGICWTILCDFLESRRLFTWTFGTILGDFLDSRRLLVDVGIIIRTLLSMDLLVVARKLGTILGDFFDSRRLLVDFGTILCTLLSMDLLVVARKLTTS